MTLLTLYNYSAASLEPRPDALIPRDLLFDLGISAVYPSPAGLRARRSNSNNGSGGSNKPLEYTNSGNRSALRGHLSSRQDSGESQRSQRKKRASPGLRIAHALFVTPAPAISRPASFIVVGPADGRANSCPDVLPDVIAGARARARGRLLPSHITGGLSLFLLGINSMLNSYRADKVTPRRLAFSVDTPPTETRRHFPSSAFPQLCRDSNAI